MFALTPLPRTLAAGLRDLQHQSPKVRLDAARDLARVPDEAERGARVHALCLALGDTEPSVREQAVLSLADLGDSSAVDAILPLLGDTDTKVRQMAVVAVGELAEPSRSDVVGRLAGLLETGAPALRYQALIGLVRLGAEHRQEALVAALRDPDAKIRELSLRLIDENLVDESESVAPDGWVARAVLGKLDDPEAQVQTVAQILAADYGLDASREHVVQLVTGARRPMEARDEQMAIQLAGRLKLASCTAALRRRAFGLLGFSLDPFRWDARAALARQGDPRAIAYLERGLSARSPLRRSQCAFAIGLAGLRTLRPRLEKLRGQPALVDQQILEEALAALDRHSSRP